MACAVYTGEVSLGTLVSVDVLEAVSGVLRGQLDLKH